MIKKVLKIILFSLFVIFTSCTKFKINDTNTVRIPIENKPVDIIYSNQKYQNRTQITYSEMQEDLETFIYLLETSYIGYDDALERGLDTNVQRQKVLGYFENQEVIQIQDFLDVLYKAFEDYIQDKHASVMYRNNNDYRAFIKSANIFFSDVYVKKNAGDYFVCESDQPEINTGARYISDVEYLFIYPSKGNDVYRIGCISTGNPEKLILEFDGKPFDVQLKQCFTAKGNDEFSSFDLEMDKSIYIKLNRCYFNNDRELKSLHKIAESYKSCMDKDYVILDVRGNEGGDDYYLNNFLNGLYNLKKSEINYGTNTRTVYSPANIKSFKTIIPYYADVNNPEVKKMLKEISFYEKQMKKNPQKIIKNEIYEKTILDEPEFKGKLIILTDKASASAGEDVIAYGYALFGKTGQIIQVGQNTAGCQLFGNRMDYVLTKSGIDVHFSITDFAAVTKLAPNFHGEGYGYYPDYWATNEDINETIFALTGDKQMYEVLNNIF